MPEEWNRSTDPIAMLHLLDSLGATRPRRLLFWVRPGRPKPSDRKLRLFAAACCRRIWHRLPQGPPPEKRVSGLAEPLPIPTELNLEAVEHAEKFYFRLDFNHDAVELAERFADGLATLKELDDALPLFQRFSIRNEPLDGDHAFQTWQVILPNAWGAAALTARAAALGGDLPWVAEKTVQAALLRDIVYNPFKPEPKINPAWLTPQVTALAKQAYEKRSLPEGALEPGRLAGVAGALAHASCQNAELLTHLREPGSHLRGCWALDLLLGKL